MDMTTDSNRTRALPKRHELGAADSPNVTYDIVQLDPGRLSLWQSEIRFDDVLVKRYRFSHSVAIDSQYGAGWSSFVLVGPEAKEGACWNGVPVLQNSLLRLKPEIDHTFVGPAGWSDYEINIRDDVLNALGDIPKDDSSRLSGYLRPTKSAAAKATRQLQTLFASKTSSGEEDISPTERFFARTQVLSLLKDLLASASHAGSSLSTVNRYRRYSLVERALAVVKADTGWFLTVEDLCERLGANPRGMQRAFNDVMGISPYQFLLRRRLTKAHYDLAVSLDASVSKVSDTYGFASPSEFASHYKKFFGELPSQTLRENPLH